MHVRLLICAAIEPAENRVIFSKEGLDLFKCFPSGLSTLASIYWPSREDRCLTYVRTHEIDEENGGKVEYKRPDPDPCTNSVQGNPSGKNREKGEYPYPK